MPEQDRPPGKLVQQQSSDGATASAGYSVWIQSKGRWELTPGQCAEGFEPGPPPAERALYEGQAVRKEWVRSLAATSR